QKDFYISLLYKELDQSISEEEAAQLKAWLKESPENQELADQIRHVWQEGDKLGAKPEVDLDQAFADLEAKISLEEETLKPAKVRPIGNRWMRIAAAITFLIAGAFLLNDLLKKPEVKWQVVESGESRKNIALPDQSVIQLKEHSKISYPESFAGDIRLVKLEGEAFFDVERNPQKAFEVEMDQAKVRVLGTSFLIRAFPTEGENLLQVESGKVSFSSSQSNTELILTQGEQAVLNKSSNELEKREDISENERAWATKKLNFENDTLEEILEVLSDVYKVEFSWKTKAGIACPFTSDFDNEDLENILATITQILEVQFTETSRNVYTVEGGSCE
ncbi:MAG: FecR domain-containing protein, partial [Bacteroidota bacterium]